MRAHTRLFLLVLVVHVCAGIVECAIGSLLGLILLVRPAVSSCPSLSFIGLLLLLTTQGYLSIFIKDAVWVSEVAHVVCTHGLLIRKHALSAILPLFAACVHHSII